MYRLLSNHRLGLFSRLVWATTYGFQQEFNTTPSISEVADALGLSQPEVVTAFEELNSILPQSVVFNPNRGAQSPIRALVLKSPRAEPLKCPINAFDGSNPVLTLSRAFDAACALFCSANKPSKDRSYPIFRAMLRKYPKLDLRTEVKAFVKGFSANSPKTPTPQDFARWLENKDRMYNRKSKQST